ncbi:MAG: hypothetical protein Q9187_004887 [Circinaria calcarea]
MSYSPATPDKSFKDASKYPAKIVIPNLDKQSTSKVKQASLNEPSPASTYGGTAAGDSVPVTPQEVNDPAILIRSLKSTQLGGVDDYTEGSSGDHPASRHYVHPGNRIDTPHGLGAVETSPSQKATWDKATRYSNTSAGSSPTAQRKQSSIMDSPTWRRSGFVQESASQPDPFVTRTPEQVTKVGDDTVQFRPREDRAGLQIDGDNAQAVLPPNACVFVANLSTSRTDDQLEHSVQREFSAFGTVYVKIRRDSRGMPYAFCQYEHLADSERAIQNGSLYLSRIAGGPISEDEARSVLSRYGALEKIWLCTPTDKEMFRLPDGIWVMFAYFQDCRDAQSGMRDSATYRLEQPPVPDEIRSRLNSRHMTPPAAARGSPIRDYNSPQARMRRAADRCCIFVGNLPSTVTQEQLAEVFGSCGRINGIEVISKPSPNVTTGLNVFAYIEFSHEEEALRAISHDLYRQRFIQGTHLRVELKEPSDSLSRRSRMTSAGSPRNRNGLESPDSFALLYHRAVAMGINPIAAATLFSVSPSQNMSHTPMAPAMYAQYPYYPCYAPQYGQYGTQEPNIDGDTTGATHNGSPIHGTAQQQLSQTMGQFQYPQNTGSYIQYHNYPMPAPYVWPPANTEGNTATSTNNTGSNR